MSLGTVTVGDKAGQKRAPQFVDHLQFAGDGAYPSGGTADFQEYVQAAFGDKREVIGVLGQDCGDFVPVYDKANDKLKVYKRSDGAEASGNLSTTTFNILVFSY